MTTLYPLYYHPNDPTTWRAPRPLIIAHDVGGFHDHSTAVVGGNCPIGPRILGITECHELPQGLYGSPRAAALAQIDASHDRNAIIVADLSSDRSYAEALQETFGVRVVGLQIHRYGDGMDFEYRPVNGTVMLIYKVGRSTLLEAFHADLQADRVRFIPGPMAQRAFAQLAGLETEMRVTGIVYKCPAGQHDDLAISCTMLAWAVRHPHLQSWYNRGVIARRPRPARPRVSSAGWT